MTDTSKEAVAAMVERLGEGVDGDPNVGLAPANDAMSEAAAMLTAMQAERDALREAKAQVEAYRGQIEYLLGLFPSGIFNRDYTRRDDVISFMLHTKEAATVRNIKDYLTNAQEPSQ